MLGLEFKESYKNKTVSCDGVTSEAIISGKERMKLGWEGLKPEHLARCLLSPDSSLICLVFTGDKDSTAAVLQRLGRPSCIIPCCSRWKADPSFVRKASARWVCPGVQ